MRIGLIIYGNLNNVSGGYLYDRMLVEYLRRQGDTVEIVSLPWRNYSRHLMDNFSQALFRRLCQSPLDILLQDELNHPSLFWLNQRLQKQTRYPIISIVHHLRCSEAHSAWANQFYRRIERHYLDHVNAFVFNSQTTQNSVQTLTNTKVKNHVAYPAGNRLRPIITEAQITARTQQNGPLQIVFLGNLIERKGLHILLDTLANIAAENWQLDVIGSLTTDPIYVEFIREQINRSKLKQRANLAGPLSDAELAIRLTHSHVMIVPSSYEGFGIVYMEGMGFGLPAIASTAGAAQEIITHGQNGFLVPPDDSATLAQYITQLCQDREQLLQMSLAARQRYTQHPTWNECTQSIREFLQTFTT